MGSFHSSPLVRDASAKLNLGLKIIGRRHDGYHDLISVFQAIDFCDSLTATEAADLTMSCSEETLPTDGRNLVLKAADELRKTTDSRSGAHIDLTKRIPAGAGLGGGSSDAATTVRLLSELWGCELSDDVAIELCGKIGSDVPFFWYGGTALVTGRGESVRPISPKGSAAFVVVTPPLTIDTGPVFGLFDLSATNAGGYSEAAGALADGTMDLLDFAQHIENDFTPIISNKHHQIEDIRRALLDAGALAADMAGTGSAVYGVFKRSDDFSGAADRLRADGFAAHACLPQQPTVC